MTDTTTDTKDLYLLIHLPKCAGTTVETYVRSTFPDAFAWPLRRRAPGRYFSRPYYRMTENPALQTQPAVFVIGHFFGESIAAKFPGRQIKRSVLLRDPVGFLLSFYNFRVQRYMEKGMKSFPFEMWYNSQASNPMSDFLLNRYLELPFSRLRLMPPDERLDILTETLRSFWHVSSYRECGSLIAKIAAERNAPADFEIANVTRTRTLAFDDLAPSMRERIVADNRVDAALFERFCDGNTQPVSLPDDRLASLRREVQRPIYTLRYRVARSYGV